MATDADTKVATVAACTNLLARLVIQLVSELRSQHGFDARPLIAALSAISEQQQAELVTPALSKEMNAAVQVRCDDFALYLLSLLKPTEADR